MSVEFPGYYTGGSPAGLFIEKHVKPFDKDSCIDHWNSIEIGIMIKRGLGELLFPQQFSKQRCDFNQGQKNGAGILVFFAALYNNINFIWKFATHETEEEQGNGDM